VRLWRVTAAAEWTLPCRFSLSRLSRREQSLGPSHTTVAKRRRCGSPGGLRDGDLFAA